MLTTFLEICDPKSARRRCAHVFDCGIVGGQRGAVVARQTIRKYISRPCSIPLVFLRIRAQWPAFNKDQRMSRVNPEIERVPVPVRELSLRSIRHKALPDLYI